MLDKSLIIYLSLKDKTRDKFPYLQYHSVVLFSNIHLSATKPVIFLMQNAECQVGGLASVSDGKNVIRNSCAHHYGAANFS